MKNKIYFGHPVNTYNTEFEKSIEEKINTLFSQYDILNPNGKQHQEGYQEFKKKYGNGMKYFYEEVLPQTEAGIYLLFPEGTLGAGVGGEMNYHIDNGKPVFIMNHRKDLIHERKFSNLSILSVEETRDRVYNFNYWGHRK